MVLGAFHPRAFFRCNRRQACRTDAARYSSERSWNIERGFLITSRSEIFDRHGRNPRHKADPSLAVSLKTGGIMAG